MITIFHQVRSFRGNFSKAIFGFFQQWFTLCRFNNAVSKLSRQTWRILVENSIKLNLFGSVFKPRSMVTMDGLFRKFRVDTFCQKPFMPKF